MHLNTSGSLTIMSSGRGRIKGPEAALILSAPLGGRFAWVNARIPLSDLQVLEGNLLK